MAIQPPENRNLANHQAGLDPDILIPALRLWPGFRKRDSWRLPDISDIRQKSEPVMGNYDKRLLLLATQRNM